MTRQDTLRHLRDNPEISVLIIGGGVNGIGTFRDLALQGIDVLLVEKDDFCSGASAASSHMVHGGIRYLENGEFRLVREAVQERNRLIENAPHYVKPLPTVIPIYKHFSGLLNAPLKFAGLLNRPSERGSLVIKIGLVIYDAFTRNQGTLPRHQFKSRRASLVEFPRINPNVRYTARYFDGSMLSPERICIELALDGTAANEQAKILNYAAVVSASENTVIIKDQFTGETLEIHPDLVVNATGPWIDFTNTRMGLKTNFIGGTKGSHLVLDNPELREAIGDNEFFFENKDGRIVIINPIMDKVMIGTSDLPISNPDDARCSEAEIDYFFDMVPHVFPGISINREQIIFMFSGVRPLPASDANTTGQVSRDHSIRVTDPGNGIGFPVYHLIGGKWTSFRAFSEEVTDKILTNFNRHRMVDTRNLAIGGGLNYPETQKAIEGWISEIAKNSSLSKERVAELFQRYGTRAHFLVDYISQGSDTYLNDLPGYSRREIEFVTRNEHVARLDDLLLRRSMVAVLGMLSRANVKEVASVVGAVLEWSPKQIEAELARTDRILQEYHRVEL